MIRFLHVSDLHIDRAFEGVRPTEELFSNRLLLANEKTLKKIIDVAIERKVDFLIFAGDTFHRTFSSPKTQKVIASALSRLRDLDISVFLVFGNHDYYEESRFWFRFSENVHLFTEEDVSTVMKTTKSGAKVAISGFSYRRPWISERKILDFPERLKDIDYHLGIYHGELGGENSRYAPFSLQEMQTKRYDYWALGHIHQAEVLDSEGRIRYAGAPIGHTRKEKNSHCVNLVELDQEVLKVEEISVAALVFQVLSCDVSEIQNMEDLRLYLQRRIEEAKISEMQFVEIQLENVLDSLIPSLDEFELIEFFNSLYPLQLSISKISWRAAMDVQQKVLIPFEKREIEERFDQFHKQDLLSTLSKPLASKRGLENLLEFVDSSFQAEVYEEAKRRFYLFFEVNKEV
ncbi:MAG: metallophosphoesterase [Lactobacillales bacterium]|nr:metallophosphoesterase [Lactobacillales bacterium]